jgi:hypothetical protein
MVARRSRRDLRQSPDRDGGGSTHIDPAFMGLTSSGVGTVNGTLLERDAEVGWVERRIGATGRAAIDMGLTWAGSTRAPEP